MPASKLKLPKNKQCDKESCCNRATTRFKKQWICDDCLSPPMPITDAERDAAFRTGISSMALAQELPKNDISYYQLKKELAEMRKRSNVKITQYRNYPAR